MDYHNEAREGLLYGAGNEVPKRVENADKFFDNIYRYYVAKGIGATILSELCSLVTLGFTISFSVFMLAFVDWGFLVNCHDEESCSDSVIVNPFHESPSMFRFFILLYFILFASLWVYTCVDTLSKISDALEMSSFYQNTLGIKVIDLQHMEWHEVVERITFVHNNGDQQLVGKDKITEHDVVMLIMRKENYLVGLINKNKLDLFVPWWISPFTTEQLFLTKSLEWSLSFCIMDYMFTDNFLLSSEFTNDVAGLQWRFQVVGLIHFLLLPFMLIFMAVHFFLQNAQQFHSSKAYLGPRQWSPLAQWKFREFNELPHVFDDRINRSLAPANDYIATFHNPYTAILCRCTTYITGAFIATLLLVSFLSDGALLYVHIADYNLLWYLGVFSACYAAARSQIPDETKAQVPSAQLLQQVGSHTHFFPPHWQRHERSEEVKNEVCEMFQFKAQIFVMELLSVVLTPAVLCFSLPACADTVLRFIREHTKNVEGVGAVCDFSLFEVEQHGDENFGAEKSGFVPQSERPSDGKMEKSIMNFKRTHPNFEGGVAAQGVYNRLNAFKEARRQEQREQVLASIMEQNREAMYDSNAFAGAAVGTDSPEPSSPVTRHGQHHGGGLDQDSSGFDSTMMGAAPHQPGYRIQSNASLGAYGSGTVVSRPVSFGLGGGNSQMPLPTTTGSTMSAASDMHLLPPDSSRHDRDHSNMQSGLEHDGDSSSHMFEGAFASNERNHNMQTAGNNVAASNMDLGSSDSEEVTSPIIRRESDILGGATGAQQASSRDSDRKPVPAALPAQIEMASIFNQSQQHQSILRGFHNHGSSRSLFESNMNANRRSGHQHRSKGDLPSVLLSIMRQENIDYENDFYWMTQFHAERLRDPAGVERSLVHSPRGGFGGMGYSRARRSVSGGVGSSSVIGGFMSPLRAGMSRHSTPPFAAEHEHQPFSPGMNASAMGSASGMYLSNLPSGQHGYHGQHGHHQHMSGHSTSTAGLPDQDSPRFTYGSGSGDSSSNGGLHNTAGGGVPVTPTSTPVPTTMPAPGLNWGSPSSSDGGFVQHTAVPTAGPSAGAFARRPHGPPAAGQKKSVSGLDCLNENDAEEG